MIGNISMDYIYFAYPRAKLPEGYNHLTFRELVKSIPEINIYNISILKDDLKDSNVLVLASFPDKTSLEPIIDDLMKVPHMFTAWKPRDEEIHVPYDVNGNQIHVGSLILCANQKGVLQQGIVKEITAPSFRGNYINRQIKFKDASGKVILHNNPSYCLVLDKPVLR